MMEEELLPRIRRLMTRLGVQATDTEIASELARLDLPSMLAASRQEEAWEIWDGRSPINGVPAAEIRERIPDVREVLRQDPAAAIYLIRRGGRVKILQPHPPGTEGFAPMTSAEATSHATAEHEVRAVRRRDGVAAAVVVDRLRRVTSR